MPEKQHWILRLKEDSKFLQLFLKQCNVAHSKMIAVISPIKEADSAVIVTYPRIALKRPFQPEATTTVGATGDQHLAPPVQKQVS